MCGLAGIFRPAWTDREKQAIIDLTLISQVRGIDSTGIIKLSQSKKNLFYGVDKAAERANLFLYKRRSTFLTPPEPNTTMYGMLVHVRAATKGSITDGNAHPFSFDRVVGMHNGTIHGTFKYSNKYDTDSEALYHNLDEAESIEEGLKEVNKAYSKVAYALQFYDKETGQIHFIRNKERPLFMAWEQSTDTYVVASEKVFIKFLERKHKFKFKRIHQLSENKLYTIQMTKKGHFHFSEKQLKVEKPVTTYNYGGNKSPYSGAYHGHGYNNSNNKWSPPGTSQGFELFSTMKWPTNEYLKNLEEQRFKDETPPFEGSKQKSLAVIPNSGNNTKNLGGSEDSKTVDKIVERQETQEILNLEPPYHNASRHEWEGLVADGCMYCQRVPFYNQRKQLIWLDAFSYLCPTCKSDKTISNIIPFNRTHH